jgi:hypothetical protein
MIPGIVTEAIVDLFKEINIAKNQAERLVLSVMAIVPRLFLVAMLPKYSTVRTNACESGSVSAATRFSVANARIDAVVAMLRVSARQANLNLVMIFS